MLCTSKRRDLKAQVASQVEVTDSIATVMVTRISVGTVVQLIPQRNVQLMEKSASLARRRDISNSSAEEANITIHKAIEVMAENPGRICMTLIRMRKHFRCKTMIQLMYELYILPLMSVTQPILTLFLMKSQVIGNFNDYSQM